MKRGIIKFSIVLFLVFPVLIFTQTGLLTDSLEKILQTLFLALAFSLSIIWSILRRYILLSSLLLIIIMAALFIAANETNNLISLADLSGSTGVGLIILMLLTYLPELIKKGQIDKL